MTRWCTVHLPYASAELQRLTGKLGAALFDSPTAIHSLVEEQCATRIQTIQTLQQEISVFRAAHNATVPAASALPPEILTEIFSYLHKPLSTRPAHFLNAIATCRRWHDVAIEVAGFWTDLQINNYELTAIYLNRSGSLPLSLTLADASCTDIKNVAALVAKHIQRVKSFTASSSRAREMLALLKRLDVPAPRLESMHIKYSWDVQWEDTTLELPLLFAGDMPRLHSLKLRYVSLPFDPRWGHSLTQLELCERLPSLSGMLDLLEQCSKLQVLNIRGHTEWWDDPQPLRVVSLPSLTQLTLRTDPAEIGVRLLGLLSLPASETLRVYMDVALEEETYARGPNFPDLTRLHDLHVPACATDIRRVEVLFDEARCITVRGFRDLTRLVDPELQFTILNAQSLFNLPSPLPFDCTQVESVVVATYGIVTSEEQMFDQPWDFLENMQNVKTLRVLGPDDCILRGLFDALKEARYYRPTSNVPTMRFCPTLASLEIFDFCWSDSLEEKFDDMVDTRLPPTSRGLLVDLYNAHGIPSDYDLVPCVTSGVEAEAEVPPYVWTKRVMNGRNGRELVRTAARVWDA